jgi:hypothetical protein
VQYCGPVASILDDFSVIRDDFIVDSLDLHATKAGA